MKIRWRKIFAILGTAGALSLAVYGCGDTTGTEAAAPEEQTGEQPGEAALEELSGDILEVGDGTFTVAKIHEETLENGSELAAVSVVGSEEDADRITVRYDEDTVFQKRTIRNGGVDYEDTEASAEDLALDLTAEMKGSYEGETFHASEILLVEVI